MPAWRPTPTFLTTLITFLVFGIIFLTMGLLLFFFGNQIIEVNITYHKICRDEFKFADKCEIEFEIPEDMPSPVFVYYQLDNLFQNHRRYVRSRSNTQLRGNKLTVDDLNTD